MVLEKLGAHLTTERADTVYEAMKSGKLDVSEFSMTVTDERLKLYEMINDNCFPIWHEPAPLKIL